MLDDRSEFCKQRIEYTFINNLRFLGRKEEDYFCSVPFFDDSISKGVDKISEVLG